jgi:hypothetical protein
VARWIAFLFVLAHGFAAAATEDAPTPSPAPNDLFAALARESPRGSYPKYFYGEQTYWTVVGADGDDKEALLNEEGMLEVDREAFSIEPFLRVDGRFFDWASVATSQELEQGDLPVPSVVWQAGTLSLRITAFATGSPGSSTLYARYRIDNPGTTAHEVDLFLAIRPFQVTPPWQFLNLVGGVAPIRRIAFDGRQVVVNGGEKRVILHTVADGFGALSFAEGPLVDSLRRGVLPEASKVADPAGLASGALRFTLSIEAGGHRDIHVAVPFHEQSAPAVAPGEELTAAIQHWQRRLAGPAIELPPSAAQIARTLRSTLGYILVNRDGPAIRPGSRCYERSWIRDGSLTSTALLEFGFAVEAREFIEWYAGFQFPDGKIPCCVDRRGADPTPEHDSNGEFIYAVMEKYRFTGDRRFLEKMWPHVRRAADYLDALRRTRLTEEYLAPERRAYFGILPESISHEGYAERPVHSYWDDFFALRGLKDAAAMAAVLGEEEEARRVAAIRDAFRADLYASIARTMADHGIDTIPASVELGDFDPSATSIALSPGGEESNLPRAALVRTFERYYDDFRGRRDGRIAWDAYTPYELRNVGSFVRLGDRGRAWELLQFMLDGQRPREWNQWAEVVWRDPTAPKFIGDMPHTWVGSDFLRAVRAMLVYEREEDGALVLAAGVPPEWLAEPGVAVTDLPTHYGPLSYSLREDADGDLRMQLSGNARPPGGFVLRPPLREPIESVTLNGEPISDFADDSVVIDELPAELAIRH